MAKKRKYNKRKKATKIDIAVVALIVLSILLAVLIYTKSGVIGIKLNEILGGMFGFIQYIIPIGVFIIAIKIASDGHDEISTKLIQYAILLVSLSVMFSVFQISSNELQTNKEISEVAKDAYYLGSQSKGGGSVGAVLAVPLTKLLGEFGAIILCIGVATVLVVFTFGINASDFIARMVENAEQRKQERKEERRQERLEMREEIRNRRANREPKEVKEPRETRAQKKKRLMQNNGQEPLENQIKINFGGRFVEGPQKPEHIGETPDTQGIQTKQAKLLEKSKSANKEEAGHVKEADPEVIENNLFKDVEEQKEEKKRAVLQLEHAMAVEDEHYEYPPVELLSKGSKKAIKGGAKALTDTATKLQKTLYSFGVSARVENVSVGPAITRYELKPAEGVRVSKIANLADDIALNLAAETIRIEAPIPGKQAVGIEVPNKEREAVHLREVLDSDDFRNSKSKLTIALGKDVARKCSINRYRKNASCFNSRVNRLWKKCMYKYSYNKYNLSCKTKWSEICYGRSKSGRTISI